MQRLVFLIALILFSLYGLAYAKMLDVEADEMFKTGPRIEAYGNVVVTGDDLTLTADYVVYDTVSEDIWATGNCNLKEAKGEVNSEALSYNARRKDLHIQNGSILGYKPAVKISGESITRYSDDYITGRSVEYTNCLGSPPDWSIDADELDIPVGGYGDAKDTRFKVHEWTLFKSPYLLFPADLNRHSGLLFPEMGHGSDYGYLFGVPVYIVLGRSLDATITPTWLSTRGLLMKNELRYSLDYDQNGIMYLETLHDRLGGEKSDGGVLNTIPDDRWFFKSEQSGKSLNWDINLVSTPDYFRDIGTFYDSKFINGGISGAEINQLDDSKLDVLISRAQWVDSYQGISLALSGQWKQDLTQDDNGKTLQELPRLTARMRERAIPDTPLQTSAEFTSVMLYTQDSIEARKDNGQIEVSWPFYVFPYFTFRPYMREMYRDTVFSERKDLFSDSTYAENWEERGASLSTTLYSSRFGNGLYHQFVPQITWDYLSRMGGNYNANNPNDTFPQLLTGDDLAKTYNTVISLANYLRNNEGASLADATVDSYYSHIEGQWNEIDVRINLHPFPWLTASHINTLSKEPGRPFATSEHSSTITFTDTQGDTFSFGEEYNNPDEELIISGIHAKLVQGLTAGYDVKYDSVNHQIDDQTQALSYNSQCWAIVAERRVELNPNQLPRKTTWSLNVKLLGIGDALNANTLTTGATSK